VSGCLKRAGGRRCAQGTKGSYEMQDGYAPQTHRRVTAQTFRSSRYDTGMLSKPSGDVSGDAGIQLFEGRGRGGSKMGIRGEKYYIREQQSRTYFEDCLRVERTFPLFVSTTYTCHPKLAQVAKAGKAAALNMSERRV